MAKIIDIEKVAHTGGGRTSTKANISYDTNMLKIVSFASTDINKTKGHKQDMEFDKDMANVLYDYLGDFLGIEQNNDRR
jgi:hypothetical protein